MYNSFYNWLFDGSKVSEIPTELLSYKCPINQTYVISLFTKVPKLNHYLNSTLNNIYVYSLDRQDLFIFIKECVQKFKISRSLIQYSYYKYKTNIFNCLQMKFPFLDNMCIDILIDQIDSSPDKNIVYKTLGLVKESKPSKVRKKIKKIEKNKNTKIVNDNNKLSLSEYISKTFVIEEG